jgi:multidrug efflux pump subunit AcrA (membrane-fusion protein)
MKKGALFKTARVILVLGLSLVAAFLLLALRPEVERQVPEDTGRLVEVMPVEAGKTHMIIETFGTVEPSEALKLVAEVPGQIVRIADTFEEGLLFEKDTTLIRIDPRNYQLEVDRCSVQIRQADAEIKRLEQEVLNLKASLEIARSDTALAKADYTRQKDLVERKVVSQSSLDQAEQRYLASYERLQSLENQMALIGPKKEQLYAQRDMCHVLHRKAELDLEKTSITAPFDGWVLEKAVEAGQHVGPGQYLGTVYLDGALEIEVRVPVKDLKWLPAAVNPDHPVEAEILFANDGARHIWKGRLTRMKAQMEERTRTLPVIIGVDETRTRGAENGAILLRPGMFVRVKIKGKEIDRAFVLPRHVVHAGDVVYTVNDRRLKMKPVRVLRSYKDTVIISEGLSDGELIIKSPLSSPVEGMLLRIKAEDR